MPPAWGCTSTHNYTVVPAAPGAISFTHKPGAAGTSQQFAIPRGVETIKAAHMHRNCLLPAADGPWCGAATCAVRLNGMEQAPAPSSRSHRHCLRWP